MPKFRTKNALFGYFWTRILKFIVIFGFYVTTNDHNDFLKVLYNSKNVLDPQPLK